MSLNWIDVNEYSFNCLLLMERFQLRYLCQTDDAELRKSLGSALRGSPAVAWYVKQLLPEHAEHLDAMIASAPADADVRACELHVLAWIEDFVTYTTPEVMATKCPFVYGWHRERLYELADLNGKVVLDVGSGSGRLAFAAAQKAREVYACEPVGTLRQFLKDTITREGISNVRVVDGFVESLPYPDSTFDVIMSGHVVGDDVDTELAELERVTKDGGWILDCPGDQHCALEPNEELIRRGFECLPYMGRFGAQVCRYRKQVHK
ncbi:MAG: class I SAM-dependent methyltransferase [Clostridia bacterium]|nr:class I SAM-dependent methyltransferase [Clostridia bacterium]